MLLTFDSATGLMGRFGASVSEACSRGEIWERVCPYIEVVSPRDPERFIHIVTGESDEVVRQKIARFTTPLAKLGVEVSTGRVVDFRAKQFLVREAQNDSAPLIHPCQFNGHTQVNTTDLRNLRYPTRAELESLGRKFGDAFPGQVELDTLVEKGLL